MNVICGGIAVAVKLTVVVAVVPAGIVAGGIDAMMFVSIVI
jgi:hypothetical protein